MNSRRKMAALKKQAALKLREAGFRNMEIASLLGTSQIYVSVLLKGSEIPLHVLREPKEKKEPKAHKVNRDQDPRTLRMVELYRGGKTLEEVGYEFGVTRERARQLIRPFITPLEGGRSRLRQERDLEKKETQRKIKEERIWREFGCDFETALRLNRGIYPTTNQKGTLATAYLDQKRNMRGLYVGVEYSLTFPEWIEAWGDKLHLRGRGKWALCRIDPTKGFIAGNVRPMEIKEKARQTIARTRSRMNQIRSLEEAGMSRDQIAQQLGISEDYLSSLRLHERRMMSA